MTIALDSWAVLAILRGEPSGAYVRDRLAAERSVVSWINLGEVLYLETRRVGAARADDAVAAVTDVVDAEVPDVTLIRAAAARKAEGGLEYADAFAVATAQRHEAELLTGDPEIAALAGPSLQVVDLRER
ncbi:MAG: PIN domain-containing protein [Solirubrobacteraceae bacterium]